MHIKALFPLLLFIAMSHKEVDYRTLLDGSFKEKNSEVMQGLCEIDNYYDSIVSLKTENILMYKELNTASGSKGLIVWKKENCLYGVKFSETVEGNCKKEQVEPDNLNLGLLALTLFYSDEKSYLVSKSKFETMHDYKIKFQAIVRGKNINSEFMGSEIWNNKEFMAGISQLCQAIIYGYEETENIKTGNKSHEINNHQ